MGQQHIEFYCSICWEWPRQEDLRILPRCGHGFCAQCIEKINIRDCPKCRTRFDRKEVHKLFLEVRDRRTYAFRRAARARCPPQLEAADLQSSSRACTPSQAGDDADDSEEDKSEEKGTRYSAKVYEQAAFCTIGVQQLNQNARFELVSRIGGEITKVANGINDDNHEDSIGLLLKALSKFLIEIAAPLWDEVATSKKAVASQASLLTSNHRKIAKLKVDLLTAKMDAEKHEKENIRRSELLETALKTAEQVTMENRELERQLAEQLSKSKQLEDANRIWSMKSKKLDEKNTELKTRLERAQQELADQCTQLDHRNSLLPDDAIMYDDDSYEYDHNVEPNGTPVQSSSPAPIEPVLLPLQPPNEPSSSKSKAAPRPVVRPSFGSAWNLQSKSTAKRKRPDDSRRTQGPLKFDTRGRVVGAVQLGPRISLNKSN